MIGIDRCHNAAVLRHSMLDHKLGQLGAVPETPMRFRQDEPHLLVLG